MPYTNIHKELNKTGNTTMTIITQEMIANAESFIQRWRGVSSERSELQTFTHEFFQIFGLDRKRLTQFEKPIQKKDETGTGFAYLYSHSLLPKDLGKAHNDLDKAVDKCFRDAPFTSEPKRIEFLFE